MVGAPSALPGTPKHSAPASAAKPLDMRRDGCSTDTEAGVSSVHVGCTQRRRGWGSGHGRRESARSSTGGTVHRNGDRAGRSGVRRRESGVERAHRSASAGGRPLRRRRRRSGRHPIRADEAREVLDAAGVDAAGVDAAGLRELPLHDLLELQRRLSGGLGGGFGMSDAPASAPLRLGWGRSSTACTSRSIRSTGHPHRARTACRCSWASRAMTRRCS